MSSLLPIVFQDKRVDHYKASVGEELARFEKFLGDKKFLVGDKVSG
jgi:glutathione S-transferase